MKGKVAFHRPGTRLAFDVSLNAAVPSKDRGQPLPADGGDPGRAYLAYHKALNAGDKKAVYATLDAKHKALRDKWTQKGVDVMDAQWSDFHSKMNAVTLAGGYVHGERAVVLFEGSSKLVDRLHGEALMRRENGVWVLHAELTSVGAR